MMVVAVPFIGVKDLLDDGDQLFTFLIGPCTSPDSRFQIALRILLPRLGIRMCLSLM